MRSSSFVALSLAVSAALAGTLIACASADGEGSSESEATGDACKPLVLTTVAEKGPLCPFMAGGTVGTCEANQHCCSPGKDQGDSVCKPLGESCGFKPENKAGKDIECDSASQCADGMVCCAVVKVDPDNKCSTNMYAGSMASVCRKSCDTKTEKKLCETTADCNPGGPAPGEDAGAPKDAGPAADAGNEPPSADAGASDGGDGDGGVPADEAAAAPEGQPTPCTPVNVSNKKVVGYCGTPFKGSSSTDGGKPPAKDAGKPSTGGGNSDDDEDEDEDDTATPDAGKRTSNITPRPLALNQGGCSTSQGPAPVAPLAGLGLGLAVLALRRRKQH